MVPRRVYGRPEAIAGQSVAGAEFTDQLRASERRQLIDIGAAYARTTPLILGSPHDQIIIGKCDTRSVLVTGLQVRRGYRSHQQPERRRKSFVQVDGPRIRIRSRGTHGNKVTGDGDRRPVPVQGGATLNRQFDLLTQRLVGTTGIDVNGTAPGCGGIAANSPDYRRFGR